MLKRRVKRKMKKRRKDIFDNHRSFSLLLFFYYIEMKFTLKKHFFLYTKKFRSTQNGVADDDNKILVEKN